MKKIAQKIELAANVTIIVVAGLLCIVLVKNYFLAQPARSKSGLATSRQNSVQPGTKLSLSGIDWAQTSQTLLLALSTKCHFCSESAPFYQRLVQERGEDTRIVAVLPQPISDGKDYMSRLGVTVDGVNQVSLDSINVQGTPTLILVNGDGVVTNQWVGKLPVAQETEILSKLQRERGPR